jgi:Trm5-related predicted tRNA methylase
MQYTLRNIPAFLDRVLRRKARDRGASLNEIALEALARGMGLSEERVQHRNLRDLAGTWVEDPECDAAIRDQHAIDERLWR